MLWSTICETIGVSPHVSVGSPAPAGMVVDSSSLEQREKIFALLEEYDPRPELLNTAFYISSDSEDFDTDTERILDEDYDW